ncbi:hypothetical protein [Elizabethkingia anophelis]|jgi:hypothetical protein|uniref:hypothetical protein n=1 Tax=Elizabethkingia anophelis TaxID=1117645 RepID=UPI000442B0A2|nr:hypothetical protein [Elizabethkingia anophelis]MCT3668194.1 hypothetical protein [Elizabethkingia anophelis]MCT4011801.1 hypothetical protein [Elizabethkingia anophelis]MDV3897216.1 hypothetical protein [Elizabethkingia anophelis]OPC49622.1 hypothetical protein BAY06_10885 [Elizabethkingia anophelis]CDN75749.1 hypothetical protein E18064_50006 [Elizabethkingia anophelis]
MITKLLVIQKINDDAKVDVFQISSDNFQWTFESRRTKTKIDKEYFPFSLNGHTKIFQRQPGDETRSYIQNDRLIFCDDYGVPSGTVIGVLFPKNYIPDIIKFKDKPYIPADFVGQAVSRPPGHIQIKYNHLEKRCAIIFNIHENTLFGFKCIAKPVGDNEFPHNGNVITDDLFDVTLSREFLNVDAISDNDLKLINDTLNQADISDIKNTLNELLDAIKSGQKEKSKSLLNKIGTIFMNSTSVASNLTTLADSYKGGGLTHQFISRILDYISLL